MGPATPVFVRAHAVLGLPTVLPTRPELDEMFIGAVEDEFPSLVNRQPAMSQGPINVPRVVLASTSSQLALSPAQVDFQVHFYGDYATDAELCLGYIHRKLEAIRRGLGEIGQTPSSIGVIFTSWFSFKDRDERPAEHILKTHLRTEVEPATVQDAQAKIALRAVDKYFINLAVMNYESRSFQQPVIPGAPMPVIKPWEGTVEDQGVDLTIDVNNVLENHLRGGSPVEVTDQGVDAVLDLLRRVTNGPAAMFVDSGTVNLDELVGETA